MESLCLVFVRMEGSPTARGGTRERSPSGRTNPWSSVSSSGGNPDVHLWSIVQKGGRLGRARINSSDDV